MNILANISFCVALLAILYGSWLQYHTRFRPKKDFRSLDFNAVNRVELFIGILSARENFELRSAIRQTWLDVLNRNSTISKRVTVKFFIGNKPCLIPKSDRIDEIGCQHDVFTPTASQQDEILAVSVINGIPVGRWTQDENIGFDFKVLHPIVVTRLGAYINGNDGISTMLKIQLYDATNGEIVSSAAFDKDSRGFCTNGFCYQNITHIILPKGFKGSIVTENANINNPIFVGSNHCSFDDGQGLIRFNKIIRTNKFPGTLPNTINTHEESCIALAGSFQYKYYNDVKQNTSLGAHSKYQRYNTYMQDVNDEILGLDKESIKHSDIVFVDVLDVYKNIPLKLLLMYNWTIKNMKFSLLLKTDDDVILNVTAILNSVNYHFMMSIKNAWWGNFRKNWQVNRHGKWEDESNDCDTYPSFACGSGNILTFNIVQWLSQNQDMLHIYQGEDVSLGIWMASLKYTRIEDSHWCCARYDCHIGMYSLPDNSPNQVLNSVDNYDNLCVV